MALKCEGEKRSPENKTSFESFPCCYIAVTKRAAPANITFLLFPSEMTPALAAAAGVN